MDKDWTGKEITTQDLPEEIVVKYKVFNGKLVPVIDKWLEDTFAGYERASSGFHIPTSTRDITFRKLTSKTIDET